MIIAFETEDSKPLSNFLHVFEYPEDSGTELKSLWNSFILSYFNRKVFRVDKLVIIEMEGIFEVASEYMAYLTIIGLIVGVILQWTMMLGMVFFFIIMFLALLSPNIRTWLYVFRIKRLGHKSKVDFVTKSYVIQKLLFERSRDESK